MRMRHLNRWIAAERRGPGPVADRRLRRLLGALPELPLPSGFHAEVLRRCGLSDALADPRLDPRLVWLGHALLAATLVAVGLALPLVLPAGWLMIERLDPVAALKLANESLSAIVVWLAEGLTLWDGVVSLGTALARLRSTPEMIAAASLLLAVGLLSFVGLRRLMVELQWERNGS